MSKSLIDIPIDTMYHLNLTVRLQSRTIYGSKISAIYKRSNSMPELVLKSTRNSLSDAEQREKEQLKARIAELFAAGDMAGAMAAQYELLEKRAEWYRQQEAQGGNR